MLWFGSSAGVALAGLFSEAKSVKNWLLHGWHVAVGYVLGFFAMLLLIGWEPQEMPKDAVTGGPEVHGESGEPAGGTSKQGH